MILLVETEANLYLPTVGQSVEFGDVQVHRLAERQHDAVKAVDVVVIREVRLSLRPALIAGHTIVLSPFTYVRYLRTSYSCHFSAFPFFLLNPFCRFLASFLFSTALLTSAEHTPPLRGTGCAGIQL